MRHSFGCPHAPAAPMVLIRYPPDPGVSSGQRNQPPVHRPVVPRPPTATAIRRNGHLSQPPPPGLPPPPAVQIASRTDEDEICTRWASTPRGRRSHVALLTCHRPRKSPSSRASRCPSLSARAGPRTSPSSSPCRSYRATRATAQRTARHRGRGAGTAGASGSKVHDCRRGRAPEPGQSRAALAPPPSAQQ